MIIRYLIENVLSFKEETVLDMLAQPYKKHKNHIYTFGNLDILKFATVYGANAAGKTNLIRSLIMFKKIIVSGTKSKFDLLPSRPFKLDEKSENKPSRFEIDILIRHKRYIYGIEILERKYIIKEWLYIKKVRTKKIFERNYSTKQDQSNIILFTKSGKIKKLTEELYSKEIRNNQPFVHMAYQEKKFSEINDFCEWINNKLQFVLPKYMPNHLIMELATNQKFKELSKKLIKLSGIGIKKIEVIKIDIDKLFSIDEANKKEQVLSNLTKRNPELRSDSEGRLYSIYLNLENEPEASYINIIHNTETGDDKFLHFFEESRGTQRFLELLPAIIGTILDEYVYIIDEIDSSLHPSLLKELLRVFLNHNHNEKVGQFIFTSHTPSLLDLKLFRQDEILFTERNEYGESVLYSLSDFKPRFDLDIEKGYLNGKFGAIPYIDRSIKTWR